MDLNSVLRAAAKLRASDIHLKSGQPPIFRIDGELRPFREAPVFQPDDVRKIGLSIMSDFHRDKFEKSNEVDIGYSVPGLGRFRVNVFQQRGSIAMVLRAIPIGVSSIGDLNLPGVIKKIAMEPRGLVLCTGTTGSGKSTTLASMIDYINGIRSCHIITIEDPIEYLIRDRKSIINQREIGMDTGSFHAALRAALRQDPDVILVGEMRDLETIETALMAAETGHLVMSTLHTIDAAESLTRIVSVFPLHQQKQVRIQIAATIRGIISQRLVPRVNGVGRVPAVEVMVTTARIRECILDRDRSKEIPEAIAKGYTSYGMQSFDQSFMALVRNGLVTYDEALRNVSNPDDFALRYRGISSTSDLSWEEFEKSSGETAPAEKPKEEPEKKAAEDDLHIDRF